MQSFIINRYKTVRGVALTRGTKCLYTRGPRATIRSPANCANAELLETDDGKKK